MTKKDFAKKLSEKLRISQQDSVKFISAFLETLEHAIIKEDGITFVGFGSFKKKIRSAREGRNPQTGKSIRIPERASVRFKVGSNLEEKLN
jgi:DNA-binding protein HU-beta